MVRRTIDLSMLVYWLEEEFKNAPSIQTSVNSCVVGVCLQRRNWNQPRVRGLVLLHSKVISITREVCFCCKLVNLKAVGDTSCL